MCVCECVFVVWCVCVCVCVCVEEDEEMSLEIRRCRCLRVGRACAVLRRQQRRLGAWGRGRQEGTSRIVAMLQKW